MSAAVLALTLLVELSILAVMRALKNNADATPDEIARRRRYMPDRPPMEGLFE